MLIGIDLGTTNCLAAYYEDGQPKLIPNRLGEYLTPSVISVDENNQLYVGATAKERKMKYPDETVEVFKRSMGTGKIFEVGPRKMDAVSLSSVMLKNLKEDAEEYLGQSVTEAIISVPAYFNELQRKATKEAGELAGFSVKRIINEPTAAALAYGALKNDLEQVILAFDLGGGTFDVSILEFFDGIVEVHAIAGDNYIGGEDFTEILYALFLKKSDLAAKKLIRSEKAYIRKQCENAKLLFLEQNEVEIYCNIANETYTVTVNTDEYEKACQELLEKMRLPIERSLKDASLKIADIDDVILVGGGTKLPIVRRFISKLFGRFPNMSVNPDEAVALGAAITCAMSQRDETIKEVVLTDVCPFTLGTSTTRKGDGKLNDRLIFYPIIERNTVIPVSKTDVFCTLNDNQKLITIDILQGESRFVKNNLFLGDVTVNVPPAPAGRESVTVTYTYDVNSLLEVKVKVNSTGEEKVVILQQFGEKMSEEAAKERMKELEYLKVLPKDQEINKKVIFRGERLYEESLGMVRIQIQELLLEFDAALESQDKKEIERVRKMLTKAFDEIENS